MRVQLRTLSPLFASILLLSDPSSSFSQEWTRFRGPNGAGVSDAKTIPSEWSEDDFNWTTALPGKGLSSPVVWGERIWLTCADLSKGERSLLCVDTKKGEIRWTRSVALARFKKHKNNSFAASTPACDATRVYVLWHGPDASPLIAYDHDGKKIWERDLGPYRHGQGGASSPIVYQDMVVVANDHGKGSSLIAVGAEDGKPRWSIPREGKRACYSTPCVYRPKERPPELIFTHSFEGVSGVDPASGKERWNVLVFGTFAQRAVGSPVIAGDLVLGASGARGGERRVVAVRPGRGTNRYGAEAVYTITQSTPHVPTPIVVGDKLFLWSDLGVVSCIEVRSGESLWRGRARGNYFGSPVCVDGRLFCVSARGDVVVVGTGDSFELLARNALGERCLSTPAISGGRMYVRTDSKLFSIGGKRD